MLFRCTLCPGYPCTLEIRDDSETEPPYICPFGGPDPRWQNVPSDRSTAAPGADLLPGPFVEVPARAIARATAEGDRYTLEICRVDRLVIPCSRAAFNEAVTAMEAASHAAVE
jgi:hypothetical protein